MIIMRAYFFDVTKFGVKKITIIAIIIVKFKQIKIVNLLVRDFPQETFKPFLDFIKLRPNSNSSFSNY